jgi:hypothetical protein
MIEVTFREFLRTPKSFLPPPSDGLCITRRDGDNFYIYPNVRQTSDIMSDIVKPQEIKIENSTMPVDTEVKKMYCQLHFEKGVMYDCQLISWEDENGELRVDRKFACPKCLSKYRNLTVGTLYEI